MNVYLDTSVIAPLFINDTLSLRSEAFFSNQPLTILISDFAAVELASVVARGVRTRILTPSTARTEFESFDTWRAENTRGVTLEPIDITNAETFLRRLDLPLRAPDAIHIAIARRLGAALATFDVKMAAAAQKLGLDVAAA